MSKVLFVGDLHTKYGILERVKELSKNYDEIIFLGDYVDDWMAAPEYSEQLLKSIIDFKLANPGKIKLLLGNHDFSEWFGKPFTCSGYNYLTHQLVSPIYAKYEDLFDIAYSPNTSAFLCSHAGFTKSWLNKYFQKPFERPYDIAKVVNYAFHHRKDQNCEDIFFGFGDVGYARGGYQYPSPIWTDLNEMIADAMPGFTQVIGHTPIHTTTHYLLTKDTDFYACDTHSLFSNGLSIGDDSLLVLEDARFYKIGLDGKEIS